MLVVKIEATTPGPLTVHIFISAICFGHMVDLVKRSKVSLHELMDIESVMIRTRNNNDS